MSELSNDVREALCGSQAAFERLYAATCRAVWFTCLGFIGNREDAEDVMQNVYIAAFEKLGTLEEPEKFGAWMNRIAVNKCKDFLAQRNARPFADGGELVGAAAADIVLPEEYVENEEKRGKIAELIRGCLSDVLYQTVIMFYFVDMSIAEIAEVTECPEGTVKYRLNSARAKIKKAVLEYEEENGEKLHALAGAPFLTRLFKAEANSAEPPLHVKFSAPDNSVSGHNAPTNTVNGGKAMLNSLKSKIIAGACAAVVASGGIAAAVIIANGSKNAEKPQSPTSSLAAAGSSVGNSTAQSGVGIVSAPQITSPDGEVVLSDWEYEEINGGIRITKYSGSDEYLTVPSEIDGKQVLEVAGSDDNEPGFVFYDFDKPNSVKEITLPEGLTTIGYAAFACLPEMTGVYIPESVVVIDSGAFTDCSSLESIAIPEGARDFEFTFDNCFSLRSVKLPESARKLWNTFCDCESLERIVIPAGVDTLRYTFEGCTGLKEVIFEGGNIREIGAETFEDCTSLEAIVIPDGVVEIGELAFSGCTSLKSVTLPDSVKIIAENAFENCPALQLNS